MLAALFLIPIFAALAIWILRPAGASRLLLTGLSGVHAALTASFWFWTPKSMWQGWLILDKPGLWFLSITSLLFFAASLYSLGYLHDVSEERKQRDLLPDALPDAEEYLYVSCLLLFLGTMTLCCLSQHFGLFWVALESTTLVTSPLIYFHRHHRSLEAAWKYLVICSVGLALALFGNFLFAFAAAGGTHAADITAWHLRLASTELRIPWLKAAFIFLTVGYGTKMGLAPFHTWLPDAHSESPSAVSALLSGALLNCAFLGILRGYTVCASHGLGPFAQEILVLLGLLSLGVAAVFLLGQKDYKRMLAYSSIEHMGILAFGLGIGQAAAWGALFHSLNHSLAKGALFFTAGNILRFARTKDPLDVRGLGQTLPFTGALWVAGFFAIAGSPPFGTFMSEFLILKGALDAGKIPEAALYLFFLVVIFFGMSKTMIDMAQGNPVSGANTRPKEPFFMILPPLVLLALVLSTGVFLPKTLQDMLEAITGSWR